jgi:hypothetical protein
MLETRKLCENFFGQLVNFKIEDVKNVCEIVADDGDVCVIFDDNASDFTDMVLLEKFVYQI